jgi:hypothetical protein
MKKFSLVILFATYHMFIPFVMSHCGGPDASYDQTQTIAAPGDGDASVSECDPNSLSIVTIECLNEIMDREKKQPTVANPADDEGDDQEGEEENSDEGNNDQEGDGEENEDSLDDETDDCETSGEEGGCEEDGSEGEQEV